MTVLRRIDYNLIECKANKLLSEYFERYQKPFEGPIPIDHILEFLGYDIEFKSNGIYEDKNILGGLLPNKYKIELNESLHNQEGRMNFTIAHEIGHIVLHSEADKLRARDCREGMANVWEGASYGYYKTEAEADAFAAALLMPRKIVEEVFFSIYDKEINLRKLSFFDILTGKTKRFKGLNIAAKLKEKSQLSNVSKLSILNRLITLNLIKGLRFQKNIEYKKRKV